MGLRRVVPILAAAFLLLAPLSLPAQEANQGEAVGLGEGLTSLDNEAASVAIPVPQPLDPCPAPNPPE